MTAHKIFVDKFLDWEMVEERLKRYSNIGSHYDIDYLKQCSTKPPYYCHYLAWRMGTWRTEELFSFFDDLLLTSSSLKNWKSEEPLVRSSSFGTFWSLVWQMEVAKYFSDIKDVEVEWMVEGPDLKIKYEDKEFFVECYNFCKSFVENLFIEELFEKIDKSIKVDHQLFLKFSLPKEKKFDLFLDELFRPFLDESYIEESKQKAQKSYPVILPVPEGADNFLLYVIGENPDAYAPGVLPQGAGAPKKYLDIMVSEALRNKKDSNSLKYNHPNVLAINFLIGDDLQTAYRHYISQPDYKFPEDFFDIFDSVVFNACGINELPKMDNIFISPQYRGVHPVKTIVA